MLEQIKEEIIRIGRQAQREGLCKHKSGNFSSRDKETGYVVVTPSGVDRDLLKVDDMIVIDMDGHVIENKTGHRPSSEVLMHIAIYKKRPDVHHVVHTHSRYATVFAVLNKPIPPFVYELFPLNNKDMYIPVAPYGRPGTAALAENVASVVENCDAVLMQAHGAVAIDAASIDEAYLKACYIEELSEIYQHILSANKGEEPPLLPPEEMQKWEYPSEITF